MRVCVCVRMTIGVHLSVTSDVPKSKYLRMVPHFTNRKKEKKEKNVHQLVIELKKIIK